MEKSESRRFATIDEEELVAMEKSESRRFATIDEEELVAMRNRRLSMASKKVVQCSLNILNEYATQKGTNLTAIEQLVPAELDNFLSRLYAELRRVDGTMYAKRSLITLRYGLQQHFQTAIGTNIVADSSYKSSNDVFKAVLVKVKELGKRSVVHKMPLTPEDFKKLYMSETLSTANPTGLQNKVFVDLMVHLCNRGRENLRDFLQTDFKTNIDSDGHRYVCMIDKQTKNHRGDVSNESSQKGRMYETPGSEKCPVLSFEKYLSKLNSDYLDFWQVPLKWTALERSNWYIKSSIGKNTLYDKMKTLSSEAGLSVEYTNHCLRATCVTALDQSGFEARHITNVSGHKSEASIRSYSMYVNDQMKRKMSLTLSSHMSGVGDTNDHGNCASEHMVDGLSAMPLHVPQTATEPDEENMKESVKTAQSAAICNQIPSPPSIPVPTVCTTFGLSYPGERTTATSVSLVLPLCSMNPVSVETTKSKTFSNSANAMHEKHIEPVKLNVAVCTALTVAESLPSSSGAAASSNNADSRSPGFSACVLTLPKLTLSTPVDDTVPARSVSNTTVNLSAFSSDISVADRIDGSLDLDVSFSVASEAKGEVAEIDMACDSDNDEVSSNISSCSSLLSPTFNSPSAEEKRGHCRGRLIPGQRLTRSVAKAKVGLTNTNTSSVIKPEWLKPFEQGWRRELVFRNTDQLIGSPMSGRKCDIYYYSPTSAKLRSGPDILSYLEKTETNLTIDNFTFSKFPIHTEPLETSRCAGRTTKKIDREMHESTSSPSPNRSLWNSSLNNKRRSSVMKAPRQQNGKRLKQSFEVTTDCEIIDGENVSCKSLCRQKSPPNVPEQNINNPNASKLLTMNHQPTNSVNILPAYSSSSGVNCSPKLCSLQCPGLIGIAPTISCSVCVCLFHSLCAGQFAQRSPFICQNCSKDSVMKNLELMPRVLQVQDMRPLKVRLLSLPNNPNQNVVQAMPPLRVRPQFVSTGTNQRHSGPPCLKSFSVMNVNRKTIPNRMPPPLINTLHRIVSSSASPVRNSLPRASVTFQPVRALVSSNRMPHNTVIPPLVSLSSVTNPITMSDARPDLQQKHPVIIDMRSAPSNIYPVSNFGTTNVLPSTRPMPTMRYSNTSSSVACSRPAIELSSLPTALRSVVPVDTSLRQSANVPVSRQDACNIVSASVALSLRPSVAVISGQMMPLPHEISSKLDLSRPVSIKIGCRRILLDTDNFVKTSTGVSIAMPPDLLQQVLKPAGATVVQKDMPQGLVVGNHTAAGFCEESKIIYVDSSDSSLVDCLSITSSVSESSICSHPDQKQLLVIERHTPFRKLNAGVGSLQRIFSCLGVVDLLRASLVCSVWRHLAIQQHLWQTVHLRGLRVTDWNKAAMHLSKVVTRHLDLRGMIMHGSSIETAWTSLIDVFGELITVRRLELGPCPASVVDNALNSFWRLEHLSAECIVPTVAQRPAELNIAKFVRIDCIEQLKLRGVHGLSLSSDAGLECLGKLTKLKTLSLTTVKKVPGKSFEFIGLLQQLSVLELGDCHGWESETFEQLGRLVNLQTLRLEFGGENVGNGLTEALHKLNKLQQLELIRYVMSDDLLGQLPVLNQLRFLSLWPIESPTEFKRGWKSQCVMSAVGKMTFLCQFEWGIMNLSSNVADTIPILDSLSSSEPSSCTINDLVGQLSIKLPNTKIRIFRVPSIHQHCT